MSDKLFNLLTDLSTHEEPDSREAILHPPFAYPGSKSRSIDKIVPILPYLGVYVEPFGGSAAIMLARRHSKLEVYNDRYGGVVAFYRCIRDASLMHQLCERLDLTIHAREEFIWSRDSWENADDLVERAARWYYMTMYSFGRLGRNFGRSTSAKAKLASLQDKLTLFPRIHERFKHVQVENQDWLQCVRDYDSHDTVFYLDPPYIDADPGVYKNKLTQDEHRKFIDTVFQTKGYCAVSGYSNPVYDSQPWDHVYQWDAFVSIKSAAYTESNNKGHLEGQEERGTATECLWIKEIK